MLLNEKVNVNVNLITKKIFNLKNLYDSSVCWQINKIFKELMNFNISILSERDIFFENTLKKINRIEYLKPYMINNKI